MKSHWVMSGASNDGFVWADDAAERAAGGMRFEAVLGPPNFKEIWWLESALHAARSVARVKLPNGAATGFLIGSDLFLTNNHVFEDEQDAAAAVLQFNYRLLADGDVAPRDEWTCAPDDLFKTNPQRTPFFQDFFEKEYGGLFYKSLEFIQKDGPKVKKNN